MIAEGQIVLIRFPQTDYQGGKMRPALVIRKIPGHHEGWLICMISSQFSHKITGFDEIITTEDSEYMETGLKVSSLIRLGRLVVVNANMLAGRIGNLTDNRMSTIRWKLAEWIRSG